jgi:type I restriction enzyme S subunit
VRPRSTDSDTAEFLYYVLVAAASRGIFSESAGKSTIAHLTAEALRRYRFTFPPSSEQTAIAAFLDNETAKLDALISEAEQAISLLQERRTALISAAVTGKIDVRGLVEQDQAA